MRHLRKQSRKDRFFIITGSVVLSLVIYGYIIATIPQGILQTIRLTQLYGLTATIFLYVALLAGSFAFVFSRFSFSVHYLRERKYLAISAWYFAILHSSLGFFGQLGGFGGLGFLNNSYLMAIGLSFTALILLTVVTVVSFAWIIKKIPYAKVLEKAIYIAAFLVLIHVLMLGTHFQNIADFIPELFFIALAVLLVLESIRVDSFLQQKIPILPSAGLVTIICIAIVVAAGIVTINEPATEIPFNIHAQHIQLAKEAQNTQANSQAKPGTGLYLATRGDKTKRFTVSFQAPDNLQSGTDTQLDFHIFDASSGNPVNLFQIVYEKPMHLVIVDSALQYFAHVHPEQSGNTFSITTQFPKDGLYHLYLDFQPFGAIEQQFAFTVAVGTIDKPLTMPVNSDMKRTKTFGDYAVILSFSEPLKASLLSVGEQTMTFTILDAQTRKPVQSLKPYLGAFGHLVMINEKTYDYIHVHPTIFLNPGEQKDGGPTVIFLPLGLYGPIKSGLYRIFAEFNPDGKLFTADFGVRIE